MTSIGQRDDQRRKAGIGAYGTVARPTCTSQCEGRDPRRAAIALRRDRGRWRGLGRGSPCRRVCTSCPGRTSPPTRKQATLRLAVEAIPTQTSKDLSTLLTRETALALGYTNLYQGNPPRAQNPGVPSTVTGVNNGNLATVTGASQELGAATSSVATGINFEPTAKVGLKFIGPFKSSVEGDPAQLQARVIGDVRFNAWANQVQHAPAKATRSGRTRYSPSSSHRASTTGSNVTITSQLGGVTTSGTTATTTTGASRSALASWPSRAS